MTQAAPKPTKVDDAIGGVAGWADDRFGAAQGLRRQLNKVFPDHWSFMLGEIALYSFVILLLTGTYLTLFFDPSLREVVYDGSYTPLRGVEMSASYATTLDISFDVRGGLVIRQIHHWAALLFMAAIVVHLLRVFFTGAFRRPREVNWMIGVTLLVLGIAEGFAGYSLPDDLLSGTGLRIMSAIVLSIPVVGTWLSFAIFGDEFPGELIIGRLYIAHVLLIPGIILALISAHMAILWVQKHTQFPGPGRTETNVVGERVFPVFGAKTTGFFMLVFAVLAFLGGFAQINPIWLYGPYNPAVVSAGSQPDWYVGWLDGSTRLFPSWETRIGDYVLPAIFWPTVVMPGIVFTILAVYPFLEQYFTKDRAPHNLLQRPRDVPVRTAIGMMSIAFYVVLWISGGNDIIASRFQINLNLMTWAGRIGVLVLPAIAYYVTYRICVGLQRHDREVLAHGIESGIIERLPSGEFVEIHQPLGTGPHGELQYDGAPVPKKMNELEHPDRHRQPGFFRAKPSEEQPSLETGEQPGGPGSDKELPASKH
jgi:ubiquinol-cytochrome c reductase cytochrome b subunit